MSITGRGRFNIVVTDEYGNIAPGASVEIRTEPGLALATLFTNRNGTGPRANPLTADENGYAFAYAATGHYQLKLSVYGRERILRDVEIGRATTVDATATSFGDTLYVVPPNVGIGTASPGAKLHVMGTGTGDAEFRIAGSSSTSNYSRIIDNGMGQLKILNSASAGSLIDISPLSGSTSTAYFRFFRETNTTNVRALQVYRGDNTATVDHQMASGTAATSYLAANGGKVGIGTASPSTTLHVNGPIRHRTYTVATLPAAGTVGAGTRAAVTNANAKTFNSIVAGGGANFVPVISNGTNWRIG